MTHSTYAISLSSLAKFYDPVPLKDPKLNFIFSERKGKLTKWRLTEDLKLEKVLDKDTGAILDMKFDQGMRFGFRTSIFISRPVLFLKFPEQPKRV